MVRMGRFSMFPRCVLDLWIQLFLSFLLRAKLQGYALVHRTSSCAIERLEFGHPCNAKPLPRHKGETFRVYFLGGLAQTRIHSESHSDAAKRLSSLHLGYFGGQRNELQKTRIGPVDTKDGPGDSPLQRTCAHFPNLFVESQPLLWIRVEVSLTAPGLPQQRRDRDHKGRNNSRGFTLTNRKPKTVMTAPTIYNTLKAW